jgi:hypothetical protein
MAQHSHPVSSRRGPVAQAADPGTPPEVFTAAVGGIAALRPRPGVEFEPLPAPRRLASHSHALSASVTRRREDEQDDEEAESGSGRFVLLYEPDGHEEWLGSWRCVTFLQADLETEIAEDPLLAEVTWSWLCEALSGLGCAALGGTVSRCTSSGFGELGDQGTSTSVELRASWTPLPAVPGRAIEGPRGRLAEARGAARGTASAASATSFGDAWTQWTPQDAWDGLAAHVQAWAQCLATVAGLPPELAGVARLPRLNG